MRKQVEVTIDLEILLVVFLLVCAGLVVANWLATPGIWWAHYFTDTA